ncbi:unnamed protein product [Ectocarpus sp. 6 AP-2014]
MARQGLLSPTGSCGGKSFPLAPLKNKGVMFVVYRRLNAGRSLLLATLYDGEDTSVGVGLVFCSKYGGRYIP